MSRWSLWQESWHDCHELVSTAISTLFSFACTHSDLDSTNLWKSSRAVGPVGPQGQKELRWRRRSRDHSLKTQETHRIWSGRVTLRIFHLAHLLQNRILWRLNSIKIINVEILYGGRCVTRQQRPKHFLFKYRQFEKKCEKLTKNFKILSVSRWLTSRFSSWPSLAVCSSCSSLTLSSFSDPSSQVWSINHVFLF